MANGDKAERRARVEKIVNDNWPPRNATSNTRSKKKRQLIDALVEAVPPADASAAAVADDDKFSLADILSTFGDGMREAQEKLDENSRNYMRNRPAFAPDTMFRVQKFNGEIKYGLQKGRGTNFNLVLFGKKDSESQQLEQTLLFDIVAVEPPPDALAAMNELPSASLLVTNREERERILGALRGYRRATGKVLSPLGQKPTTQKVFDSMLILRGEEGWLAFSYQVTTQNSSESRLVWWARIPYSLDPNEIQTNEHEYTVEPPAGLRPLLQILVETAQRQASELALLRQKSGG